jgi:hypothetical protein
MGLECFEIIDGILGGWRTGTRLRVKDYAEPLPETLAFLKDNARRISRPENFDQLTLVDVAAARAEAQALSQPPPQDRHLDSKELWRKLPFTRDAHQFDIACSQYAFPTLKKEHWFNRNDTPTYCWSEAAVDRWIADMRTRRDQIERFLDGAR